jgi:hypothetical protein
MQWSKQKGEKDRQDRKSDDQNKKEKGIDWTDNTMVKTKRRKG